MSDNDSTGSAWHVAPSAYAAKRDASCNLRKDRVFSRYVRMSDGCRLAVDVYLPGCAEDGDGRAMTRRFPTIVIFTPYTRRFSTTDANVENAPNIAKYRDFFVPYGYAVVVVDLRGTGASFGTRIALRSPKERDDTQEIAQWIVEQPWSDGTIGSTGISYLGAASCFLASTGHAAVKAIAPLFAVSDIYAEQLFPGGILSRIWSRNYDELMVALDRNDRRALERFAYFGDPRLSGPQPVDEDDDGRLLEQALDGHKNNFRLHDMMPELAFRDEGPLHDPSLKTDACSPYYYLKSGMNPGVPVYSVSGWYDGGGYANGAISRFLSLAGPRDRLLLGPWDHGARTNISPWRARPASDFPLMHELLRFFDQHVQGLETRLDDESPVHYYCVHAERWMSAQAWPPVADTRRMYFGSGAKLAGEPLPASAGDSYQVHFDTTTGTHTRWERLGAHEIDTYYDDWAGRDAELLNYTSDVFQEDTELSGHIVVSISFTCSETDAALFVYASEVEEDGTRRYMTEGMLRMLHRQTLPPPAAYATTWPYRSFHRKDARLLAPGRPDVARFALLPISWCLKAGSRLRLSIAGADADHFPQVPHGRPPRLDIHIGGADGSYVDIPVRPLSGKP
ncbi:MAG: CocE/NonD family hydrolase [Alcaligenaceae bacterium]|nr:CocE/NonD family hydrolase [Alcaligenaceae bacterium]